MSRDFHVIVYYYFLFLFLFLPLNQMRIRICHVFRTNPRERISDMEEKNSANGEERFAIHSLGADIFLLPCLFLRTGI